MPVTRARRRLLTTAAVPAGLLLLTGCLHSAPAQRSGTAANERIAAAVERQLAGEQGVSSAQARYQDDVTSPGSASVDVTMEPGADQEALYADAVRLVWTSRLNPLDSISVNVINPDDPPSGLSRTIDLLDAANRSPLEQKYGPHPK